MFKKPTKKKATSVATQVVAFEAGKRISRGLVGLNLTSNPNHARLGIAAVTLIAAASYDGKNKEVVQAALIGSAVEQGGRMIDDYAKVAITPNQSPDAATKFLYDTLGLNSPYDMLNGSCGCSGGLSLPNASLVEVDYYEDADVVSSSFTGL